MKKITLFLFIIGIVLVSGCADTDTGGNMENIVKEGDYVKVNYIGELEDGTIFDTSIEDAAIEGGVYNQNRGYEPLGFTVGAGQMIPGFDRGVIGMSVGEEKTLTLPPKDAYGEYSEERIQTISLEELESVGIFPAVGDKLSTPQGVVTVINVTDTEVKLDYNHDLVGKTLIFKVTLVSIMENVVKEGDYVKVDYIGELEDGTVFDTSIGREPLGFTVGAGQMIAGFDRGVVGMTVGEEKTLTLPPKDAYGESSANNNHPLAGKTLIFKVTLVSIGQE